MKRLGEANEMYILLKRAVHEGMKEFRKHIVLHNDK